MLDSRLNNIMLTNKYSKLYHIITSNAKQRIIDRYTETHHIIPQSLGGSNDKENLVELTAREHFICHWLLIKMTEGKNRSKMLYALNGMKAENRYQQRYHTKITARVYEKYRIEHSENHSKRMKGKAPPNKGKAMSEEQKHKLRMIALKRPKPSAETIAKRSQKIIGQKRTRETKLKMSLAAKGKPKGPMSEEEKIKRSMKLSGKRKKEGHSDKVRTAVLGNISINKDGVEKKVKKDTLEQWLSQGWKIGGRPRKTNI
jgi:hypothetical protein